MQYIKLGELVDLKQGMAINAKSNHLVSQEETDLALLRIADMPTKSKTIFMDINTPKRFIASEKDIIYTRTGQVGLVFRNQYGVVHNNCFRVYPLDEKKLDRDYLYWALKLKPIYVWANNIAGGSAQPDLPHSSFKKMKIPFVEIEEQKKIASILNNFEYIIEKNNKKIECLEQTLSDYFLMFFKDKEYEIVRLGDYITITRGISYSSEEIDTNEGVNLINLKNINSYGGFRRDGTKKYDGKYKNTQTVKNKDLVMGVTDMTQDRRAVGSCALIPKLKGISVISADLVKIESDFNNIFLYCAFKYGGYSKYISQFANGANVLHLKPEAINKIKFKKYDSNVIEDFSKIASTILDEIELLNLINENLMEQLEITLPRLMITE